MPTTPILNSSVRNAGHRRVHFYSAALVFNFENHNVRTFVDENGEVWFVAKDVCDVLGFVNGRDAVKRLCKECGVGKYYIGVVTGKKADGSDAIQQVLTTFIDQSNVFRVICHSNLPKAEKFEAWVFEEVLPTIRKTGKYEAPNREVNHLSPEVLTVLRQAVTMMFTIVVTKSALTAPYLQFIVT